MKTNVGTVDRVIRALVGVGLIAWALATGALWAWIGIVPLATAAAGFCPAYKVFGFSTCPAEPPATPKM